MTKLAGDGRVFLTEQSSAGVDVPGDGQIWVKDDTPNVLKFTDDAGTDFSLATTTDLDARYVMELATTLGSVTNHDWTSLPTGIDEFTFEFASLSTNGAALTIIQLGDAGGFETTAYAGTTTNIITDTNLTSTAHSTGYLLAGAQSASSIINGSAKFVRLRGTNSFMFSLSGGASNIAGSICGGGYKNLSSVLTQVRLTTVGGAGTFDSGTVALSYKIGSDS